MFRTKTTMIPEIDVNEGINKDIEILTKPWGFQKQKQYIFSHANVVDSVSGKILKDYSVVLQGGLIEMVCPSSNVSSKISDLSKYEEVDCTGKYLCPGLFDFHVHMVAVQGEDGLRQTLRLPKETMLMRVGAHSRAMLERGFTSIRDCGGMEHFIADAINDNIIVGPRSFFCGKALSQTGGHADLREGGLPSESFDSCECHLSNLGVVADGPAACMKAARENFRRGASFIKIMAGGGVASPSDQIDHLQYTVSELETIVEVANSYNSYVTAHAYTPQAIIRCAKYGVKGIEHGNLLDDEAAKVLVENDCYMCPTLITYKVLASDQFSKFLPASSKSKNSIVLKKGMESLMIAKKHGVKICYGSDLLGSLAGYQNNEFSIRSKVMEPLEILQSATITPAEIMKMGDKIGQIAEGFFADILVLDANPLDDITILENPDQHLLAVMKDGWTYHTKWSGLNSDVPTSFVYR